jgi:hypothetical protein
MKSKRVYNKGRRLGKKDKKYRGKEYGKTEHKIPSDIKRRGTRDIAEAHTKRENSGV